MWFEIFLYRVRALPGGFSRPGGGFLYREAPGQTGRVDTYGSIYRTAHINEAKVDQDETCV